MKNVLLILAAFTLVIAACGPQSASGDPSKSPNWVHDWNAAVEQSKKEGKPMFIDFYATWCGPCKMMDRQTYSHDGVIAELTNWIPVKVDVDRQGVVAREFNINAMPTSVMVLDGRILGREEGFMGPGELITFLERGRKKLAQ